MAKPQQAQAQVPDPQPRRPALHQTDWLAYAIFIATLGYGIWRIQFGIDYSDEGSYLCAPMRYALGDLPFRDEIGNPQRAFDVVLAPLFMLVQGISVYHLRLAWIIGQFASMLVLYSLLRRYATNVIVAAACCAVLWLPNFMWTPGYHTMGATFFTLAWALWLKGCVAGERRRSLFSGIASGIALSIGIVSYLPLVGVLTVPTAVLLAVWCRAGQGAPPVAATMGQLVTVVFCVIVAGLSLVKYGLWDAWLYAWHAFLTEPRYAVGLAEKWTLFVSQTLPHWRTVVASALIGVLTLEATRRLGLPDNPRAAVLKSTARLLVPPLAGCLALLAVIFRLDVADVGEFVLSEWPFSTSIRLFALIIGWHLGSLMFLSLRKARATPDGWGVVYGSLVSASLMFAFVHAFFSLQAFKMIFGILPLAASGAVATYRAALGCPTSRKAQATMCSLAFCLAVAAGGVYVRMGCDRGIQLTKAFSIPQLSGLWAPPADVDAIEATVRYLSARLARGEFLLAYWDIPVVYYLTQTRPAGDQCWSSARWPVRLRSESLRRMIERRRVARYAVRYRGPWTETYSTDPDKDPLNAFVSSNYTLEARFLPFEIWRLQEGREWAR